MRRRCRLAVALLAISVVGCAPTGAPDGAQQLSTPAAPTLEVAAGARYLLDIEGGDEAARTITLVDGNFEDAELYEAVGLIPDVQLRSDLDGDGVDDLVVLLVETSGGSGSFSYLAPLLSSAAARPAPATFVGDRVALRGWSMEGATVRLDVLQAGPEDPMCCPGELATRRWELQGDRLAEKAPELVGRMSTAAVAGSWKLVGWDPQEPFSGGDVEVTLTIADGAVSGGSGCNRYTGTFTEGDSAGAVSMGPLTATRMACPGAPMEVEERYLKALGGATGLGFFQGTLAVNYNYEDTYGMLIFEPTAGEQP